MSAPAARGHKRAFSLIRVVKGGWLYSFGVAVFHSKWNGNSFEIVHWVSMLRRNLLLTQSELQIGSAPLFRRRHWPFEMNFNASVAAFFTARFEIYSCHAQIQTTNILSVIISIHK